MKINDIVEFKIIKTRNSQGILINHGICIDRLRYTGMSEENILNVLRDNKLSRGKVIGENYVAGRGRMVSVELSFGTFDFRSDWIKIVSQKRAGHHLTSIFKDV